MTVYDAIKSRRTIRKFTQEAVSEDILLKLADCGRLAAFGANMQPLKFGIVTDKKMLDAIFPLTKWAGYLSNGTPTEDERPTAYIAVIGDSNIRKNGMFETDAGAAVTNMMLAAQEEGLATCWLGAIDREKLKEVFGLSDNLSVVYLLAVGYPLQKSHTVEMKNDDVKYYLDENNEICVPKRSLDDVVMKF